MTKENIEFKIPADDNSSTVGENGQRKGKTIAMASKRTLPMYVAGFASLVWVGAIFLLAFLQGVFSGDQPISFADVALYAAGITPPIVIFWIIALVYQRTDPLLERRLAIAQGMSQTLAPIELAEIRLQELTANINKQLDLIEAATDIADQRIENLEDRFQEQVNDLFTATTDAEAKAANFKDMMSRERKEMEGFSIELENRLATIEVTIGKMTKQVEDSAEASRFEAQKAGIFLHGQSETMQLSAKETSSILNDIGETLERQRKEIAATSSDTRNQMEEAFEAIMGRAGNLAREIKRIEDTAETITGKVEVQALKLADLTSEASKNAQKFEDSIIRQTDDLSGAAAGALSQAAQAGEEFERQATTMEKVANETLRRAEDIFVEAGRSIAASSSAAESTARASAELAFKHLEKASVTIEELSSSLRATAKESATTTLEQLSDLQKGLAAQVNLIASAKAENTDNLEHMTQRLADQAEMIAAAADDATKNLQNAGETMDDRSRNLGQILDDTKRRLDQVEDQILVQRQSLAEATEASTSQLLDATDQLTLHSREIRVVSEEASDTLVAKAEEMENQIDKISEKGKLTADAFSLASRKLRAENKAFSGSIKMNLEAFGEAAVQFGSARDDFVANSDVAIEKLEIGTNSLVQGTMLLVNSSDAGAERMDILAKKVSQTAESTEGTVSLMADHLHTSITEARNSVKDSISDLQAQAEDDLTSLHSRFSKAVDQAVQDMEAAGKKTRKQANETVTQIAEGAEQLVGSANLFINRIAAFDDRLKLAIKDDFIKTSSLLIESLSSASVDVARLLDVEISDGAWKKYLEGDNSRFARKTIRIGDGKARKTIKKRFDDDKEFQKITLKYIEDFDSLLDRTGSESRANTLNITLMSSEMGKLYALLKESLS
jgi:hypothetical protein